MLCPRLHAQPPSGSLLPFLEPMRTLWPTPRAICAWAERDMLQMMKEMARTMDWMDQFHRQMLQEVNIPSRALGGAPIDSLSGCRHTGRSGEPFTLCLAVPGFSADELTVKLVGRKLLMAGTKETKSDDGHGTFYKYELFRREADLPEDVNLERLTCSLSGEEQLCIEAPRQALASKTEWDVPIQLCPVTAVTARSREESKWQPNKDQSKMDGQGDESTDQSKSQGEEHRDTSRSDGPEATQHFKSTTGSQD
ncbi:heat shock protein beta-11-like [Ambystoma mexicanum]|uniref:heat shock protein beta-11-like n=1 Tax=Ambystoma mexicanum TaxID=8296 RepID=UPI0037E70C2D